MIEYGELAAVVLYRDPRGDRWRYAIYDTVGVWDGWLQNLDAATPFEVAANSLATFIQEHWNQVAPWPWVEGEPGWWSAGPASI